MFLSLKANWIMYAKRNESDYNIRSLGLKWVGKWTMCPTTHTKPREVISHFDTLLPLNCNSKVGEGFWSLRNVFACLNTSLTLIVNTNNIMLIITCWESLISLTTFLYRHKLTWHVDVERCKKLHASLWQKLSTVAKGKAKIEMSPFFWF